MDWKTKAGLGISAFLVGVMALTISCGRSDDSKKETQVQTQAPSSNRITTTLLSGTIETNFPLRTLGSFRFAMPAEWQAVAQQTTSDRVPAISILFSPAQGLDFAVEFTASLAGENLPAMDTRAACEKTLKPNLASALDRRVDIQELKGPEISGHYFSITDKNLVDRLPPSGEYKYLIQGHGKMAQFATSFRIVSNNPSGEDRKAALEMIRTVRFVAR